MKLNFQTDEVFLRVLARKPAFNTVFLLYFQMQEMSTASKRLVSMVAMSEPRLPLVNLSRSWHNGVLTA